MSYTQIYLHIVFGPKDHLPLIAHTWEDEMYRYLGGIVRGLRRRLFVGVVGGGVGCGVFPGSDFVEDGVRGLAVGEEGAHSLVFGIAD